MPSPQRARLPGRSPAGARAACRAAHTCDRAVTDAQTVSCEHLKTQESLRRKQGRAAHRAAARGGWPVRHAGCRRSLVVRTLGTPTPGEGLALDPTPDGGLGRVLPRRGAGSSVPRGCRTEGRWGRPGCTTVPMAFGFAKRREQPLRTGPELATVVSTARAMG